MFDLQGFLSLLDEMEKTHKRTGALLQWQQMEDDSVRARPKQKPGPKPRAKSSTASGKPKTGGKPHTGSTPVRSSLDDERRKRGGGSGGGRAPSGKAGSSPASKKPQAAVVSAGTPVMLATPMDRSAIAAGSQSAVVKLVSFASGHSRIGALLTYQSRGGEVSAEDEAGQKLEGSSWVQDIADDWSEEDGRQPSKDVLRLSITVPAGRFDIDGDVGLALKQALPGHRIAWRSEQDGEQRRVEVVVSSAARRHHDDATPSRIYDNRKSLAALDRSLTEAFGDGAHVGRSWFFPWRRGPSPVIWDSCEGRTHDVQSARVDRTGRVRIRRRVGEPDVDRRGGARLETDLRSQERRDVAHIVLSAKPGASREAFVAASRAMLAPGIRRPSLCLRPA